jgi:hypothetical protein
MKHSQPTLALKVVAFVLLIAVLAPIPARAGLTDIFGAIDSTISNVIGHTLTQITGLQNQNSTLTQSVLWPQSLINQTKGWSRSLIGQYRGWMASVYNLPIQSAQLASPRQLEAAFGSGNVGSIPSIGAGFTQTYGALPGPNQAPIALRQTMDADDAFARDALMLTVASDQASANLLSLADGMENDAAVAPGTAAYVSASAYAATLASLAYQHKLLAAQLREEAASLADESAQMKRATESTSNLNQQMQQLLTRQ